MNESACKNCGKTVEQTPGKRAKKYCNVTCRSNHWQKEKRAAQTIKNMSAGTRFYAQRAGLIPKTYAEYKESIAQAKNIEDCQKVAQEANGDTTLASWQQREINNLAQLHSQQFEF